MTDQMGTIGRGGIVLAMSGGLVATMGGQASALTNAGQEAAVPATAPIAVQPVAALDSAILAAPASAQSAATPLTAPDAAKVTFENSAFKAVPIEVPSDLPGGSTSAPSSDFVGGAFGKTSSVITVASRYIGVPYVYGGTSPQGWDCSGAMRYIFDKVGVDLPRTANDQMLSTRRISRSEAKAGDLVFMTNGGRAYHVGIYDGNGGMYDSQRTGKSFTHRQLYSATLVFGQVQR